MKSIAIAQLFVGLSWFISAPNALANTEMTEPSMAENAVCMNISCEVDTLFIYDANRLKSGLPQELSNDVAVLATQSKRSEAIGLSEGLNESSRVSFADEEEPSNSYMATIDIESKSLLLTVNLIM